MICSYSNSAFDHDLDILDESRFLDSTIAAGGHDPVCVVLFMEVTGSVDKLTGDHISCFAELIAMNKGKQVLGHRFRGCYDMLRWSTDENKAGCFYCLYTIPADRSYFCSYCSVTAGLVIPAVCPGYYLIPTDGFLLTHTVPADLLYTDFFGRFWFLMLDGGSKFTWLVQGTMTQLNLTKLTLSHGTDELKELKDQYQELLEEVYSPEFRHRSSMMIFWYSLSTKRRTRWLHLRSCSKILRQENIDMPVLKVADFGFVVGGLSWVYCFQTEAITMDRTEGYYRRFVDGGFTDFTGMLLRRSWVFGVSMQAWESDCLCSRHTKAL
ncbi:hypothetical protein Tco_1311393 [Tanacetum coccineum]